MQWYEEEVQGLERRLVDRSRPCPVFYGSSSFRLWDTLAEDVGPEVLNLGFGGSTLEACDYFFRRLIPAARPASLLVYAGDNDLADGRSVEAVLASFRSLADKVASSLGGISFGFVSVKPSPVRYPLLGRIQQVNSAIREELAAIPGGYFVDIFPAMVDSRGWPKTEFFASDGLHLNREGYRLWGQLLQPYRNQIFTK